jgi:pantoate--beta-alanine ligase
MKIFTKKASLEAYLSKEKFNGKSIGFIPTMGALHKGHLSLIATAQKKNDLVVVSIFVNPTQFDKKEDLINYPKTFDTDKRHLEKNSCDVLFYPDVAEIYENGIRSESFYFDGLEHKMEGQFRKGHFNGVGTIVKALFQIVNPDTAYFGQKDFQQLQIIKKMVKNHNLNLEIEGCPIFREKDGLAMSSRNVRLEEKQRTAAPFIYQILQEVQNQFLKDTPTEVSLRVTEQFKNHPLLELEYFTIAEEETLETIKTKENDKKYRAFIAVFAGNIRLIDNIKLKQS